MSVSPETLKGYIPELKAAAAGLELLIEDLTDEELKKFSGSFERLTQSFPEREIAEIYLRHVKEILLGAMVAKKQMSALLDGEIPAAGKVGGPIMIRAGYLGIGDDWEDGGTSITTGSAQSWIHSGTTLMLGTSGNDVKIGENAVHVIIGYRSRHPSPKLESLQIRQDGKPKPCIILANSRIPDSLAVKDFEKAFILKHDTTFRVQIFASAAIGVTVIDIPELLGVSYIKEDVLRTYFDVASIVGTTPDVILTT